MEQKDTTLTPNINLLVDDIFYLPAREAFILNHYREQIEVVTLIHCEI